MLEAVGAQYLMESETESIRLRNKFNRDKTYQQLVQAGILDLPPFPHLVDAGCGEGSTSKLMHEILDRRYGYGELTLLDYSGKRLTAAREQLAGAEIPVNYVQCDIHQIPAPSGWADFVFCRFVFEYLDSPRAAFDELCRIAKPGGKVVVGDLDNNCLIHYPMPEKLERQLRQITSVLQERHCFDPFAGRKLYAMFHNAGLHDIKVHLVPHHLIYGQIGQSDRGNLMAKLNQLVRMQRDDMLRVDFSLAEFMDEVLRYMQSESRFSYTILVLVEGIRP